MLLLAESGLTWSCGLHTLVAPLVRIGTSVGCNRQGDHLDVWRGVIAVADCIR